MRYFILIAFFISAWNVSADYAKEQRAADSLLRAKKYNEAINALVKLANETAFRDRNFECLRKAALAADKQKDYQRALDLADKIRNRPLAKSCRMEIMLANKKNKELIEEYGNEDISLWPENCAGKGFYYRGEAYYLLKNGERAEADFHNAVKYGIRPEKLKAMRSRAYNFLKNLKDKEKALECFMDIANADIPFSYVVGGAVQQAVGMLKKRRKYDEALQLLQGRDIDKLNNGYWKTILLLDYAEIYEAQGKKAEAVAKYKEAAESKGIPRAKAEYLSKKILSLEKALAK